MAGLPAAERPRLDAALAAVEVLPRGPLRARAADCGGVAARGEPHAGSVYITERHGPNPYDGLPELTRDGAERS